MSTLTFNGRKIVRHYPVVILSVFAILLLIVEDVFLNLDVFKTIVSILDNPQYTETGEIVFSVFFIGIAIVIDQYRHVRRHKRQRALEAERLAVARSTLASVHDVVNNALNNLLLVKLEAENGAPLRAETLSLFGQLIDGLAAQLRTMSEIESVTQRDLSQGLGVLDLGQK